MSSATSPSIWLAGARPKTLPAAVAPVLVGTALAGREWVPLNALLALVVALALQIGVNYANDYSDGIRGTDRERVGPVRLVGQGLAKPGAVKTAAFLCFAVAAVAGLVLVAVVGQWWLLAIGASAIAAAWFYTGGPRPYGYAGLGEVFVFVYFGIVPVLGTMYVQQGSISWGGVVASIGVGCIITGILVTNNLRDIPSDVEAGKNTLAVRLGDARTRHLYIGLLVVGYLAVIGVALLTTPWALLGLLSIPLAFIPGKIVYSGAVGPELIAALVRTGTLVIAYSGLLTLGLVIGDVLSP